MKTVEQSKSGPLWSEKAVQVGASRLWWKRWFLSLEWNSECVTEEESGDHVQYSDLSEAMKLLLSNFAECNSKGILSAVSPRSPDLDNVKFFSTLSIYFPFFMLIYIALFLCLKLATIGDQHYGLCLSHICLLHCALSLAAQCIVIGPVCGRVCNGRAVSVTTITRNCVHRSSPNWICRCR